MDACVIEHGGVAPAAPAVRYYPQKPGYQLIAEAVRTPLSVKQFYQLTTQLSPANPLEAAPRWFWMHEVGVAERAVDRVRREVREAHEDAKAGNAKRARRGLRRVAAQAGVTL